MVLRQALRSRNDLENIVAESPGMRQIVKLVSDVLLEAGLKEQNSEKNYLTLKSPVSYESDKTKFTAYPSDEFSIDCTIEYEHVQVSKNGSDSWQDLPAHLPGGYSEWP